MAALGDMVGIAEDYTEVLEDLQPRYRAIAVRAKDCYASSLRKKRMMRGLFLLLRGGRYGTCRSGVPSQWVTVRGCVSSLWRFAFPPRPASSRRWALP